MGSRLSKNTLILLISNGGSAVLSFLLSVLIGRFYGENGLGIYASVLAWIFPLSFIVEFGFGTLMTRNIAQYPETAGNYLRLTWQFRAVVGGFIVAGIILFASFLTEDILIEHGLRISSILVIILPAYSAYTAIFRAHQRMLPIAFLNLGMLIVQVALTIIAITSNSPIIVLFVINTGTSVGQLIVAISIYRRYFLIQTHTPLNLNLRKMIGQARPFAMAGIISALQTRFSILWLESVSTPVVVGTFVASLRFIDSARMIPNAFFGAIYPALASLASNSRQLNTLFRRMSVLLFIYGVGICICFLVFGEALLGATFGEAFQSTYPALTFMAMAFIPSIVRNGWTLYWYARSRETSVNRVLILNLLMLILLTIYYTSEREVLSGVIQAILVTELLTLFLMLMSELYLWQKQRRSLLQ